MREMLVLAPTVAAVTYLFADGPALDPGVGSLIGNMGVVGFLIWFAWYQTKHGQPEMAQAFAKALEVQRHAHELSEDKLRETFERQMAELRAHSARETEELRKMLMQLMGGLRDASKDMRTAVHDVRDVVQTQANQQALADERSKHRQN